MTKLLLTTALLAFLAVPAMADEGNSGLSGGNYNNNATSSYGDGGYQHQPVSAVEWAEMRIARLQELVDEGHVYYGNSKFPLTGAIKQTRRQLAVFLEAERNGTPYAVPGTPGFNGLGNAKVPACTGSLYC
jgi:hypothetical protein